MERYEHFVVTSLKPCGFHNDRTDPCASHSSVLDWEQKPYGLKAVAKSLQT